MYILQLLRCCCLSAVCCACIDTAASSLLMLVLILQLLRCCCFSAVLVLILQLLPCCSFFGVLLLSAALLEFRLSSFTAAASPLPLPYHLSNNIRSQSTCPMLPPLLCLLAALLHQQVAGFTRFHSIQRAWSSSSSLASTPCFTSTDTHVDFTTSRWNDVMIEATFMQARWDYNLS